MSDVTRLGFRKIIQLTNKNQLIKGSDRRKTSEENSGEKRKRRELRREDKYEGYLQRDTN